MQGDRQNIEDPGSSRPTIPLARNRPSPVVVVVPKVFVEGLAEGGDAVWFVAGKKRFPEFLEERVVDLFGFAVALGSLDVAVVDPRSVRVVVNRWATNSLPRSVVTVVHAHW